MKPQFVTFTGLDCQTDLARVQKISARYPVEWGVLYGGVIGYKVGKRYPADTTISHILNTDYIRLSAHLCGRYSAWALNPSIDDAGDILSRLNLWTTSKRGFNRVQINAVNYENVDWFVVLNQMIIRSPVIMQVRGDTFPEIALSGLTWLHDESGGKGLVSSTRPSQAPEMKLVGYAGGIRPENITEVIEQIDAHTYYLDMESGVRTNDWLDLDKCEAVCKAIWPE